VPHTTTPNVLAIRFSSIGDILLTTPLLRAIRHRFPGGRITMVTKEQYVPLLSNNPHLDRVVGLAPNQTLRALAAELRQERYTHRLDLHGSLRSVALRALVRGRWSTYPKHRIARAMLIRAKRDRYRDRRPVAERYFSAAKELEVTPDGAPPDLVVGPEAEREAAEWLIASGLAGGRPIVALAPGAAHATKRWPLEHWGRLIDRLVQNGFGVALVGGPADAARAATLAGSPAVANAAGRLGLQGSAALLRRAAAAVSGDTGVMHMATAVRTPVVALFGPTVRAFGFAPYSDRSRVVELQLSCRPCSSQGGPRCPLGHHRCMVEMAPDLVYDTLRRSL
jgi:lipopolysaccharide heptosyltransferase II